MYNLLNNLFLLFKACEMFAKLSVTQQPVAADTRTMELSQQEMVDASTLKIGKITYLYIESFSIGRKMTKIL